MKDQGALKPAFFSTMPTFVNDKKAEEAGASDEERQIYSMSQTGGWKIVSDFAGSVVKDLENAIDMSVSQGLTLEEIGQNAVVANLAKGIVNRVLQKVQDAVDSCEQIDGTNK